MVQKSLCAREEHISLHTTDTSLGRRRTFTVSFPIPVFPPVTSMTFPDKSGMSSTPHVGLGGNMLVHVLDIVADD